MPPPTRSTRQSSRTSSPFAIATRNSPAPVIKETKTEQKPSPLQEWAEPPRAAPQPSFMDHHFDRTSIFQDMQPLGSMPSAKLKQKMRDSHARRVGAGEPASVMAVNEERGSAETTPAVDAQISEPPKVEQTAVQPVPSIQQEEQKPLEQVSNNVAKPPERIQRLKITNINGATPAASAANTPPRAPPTTSHSRNTSTASSIAIPLHSHQNTPSPLKSPIKMSSYTHTWNKESADAALNAAMLRADEIGGRKAMISKLALMEAFRLSERDEKLHAALAALGAGGASDEQVRRFNNYIKRSKQRLRRKLENGGDLSTSNVPFFSTSADNPTTSSYSANRGRLSLTPKLSRPATENSAHRHQVSRTTTPPGNPPPSSFHQPAIDPSLSALPSNGTSALEPVAPSTPKQTTTVSEAQTPQVETTPNGVVPSAVPTDSPMKEAPDHSSDGELSDVNETLIRRIENETYMQNQAEADSGDDRAKKNTRGKAQRVLNGKLGTQNRKREQRERAQTFAEEESRLDNERQKYRKQYEDEVRPIFPQKDDYVESMRTLPTPPVQSPPQVNGQPLSASRKTRRHQSGTPVKNEKPSLGEIQLNGARKRRAEELDDSASSLTEDLGSTPSNSAPGTPSLYPPSKKQKTAAKTKISPVKSRNGVVPGGSRLGGGRAMPFANDDNDKTSDDEHSDFCVACGGEGELLCCDGCDAAYHFECCDPPLSKDSPELEEAWYCPKCRPMPRQSRESSPGGRDSVWADMSKVAFHITQRNFQLPESLQTYFEDNSVGLDGEYVTGNVTYTRASHTKEGPDQDVDYYRLVDKKEKAILCCQCFQGVGFENARRPIIQCDKPNCFAYWHLDCLDPPLANPPTRGWAKGYQRTKIQWICPRHAEHDYREMQNPAFSSLAGHVTSAPATHTSRHRMRIPRNPEYVDYRYGLRTQGRVDIVNRDEDDDGTLRFYEEEDQGGKVVRMPEDDVKLNFIAKVKADRMVAEQQGVLKRRKVSHFDPAFQRHSFNDQRAALSLAQLADRHEELDLNSDGIAQLVYALTAQADGDIEGGDIAPNFNIDVNDRQQRDNLLKVRRLIDMALASGENPVRVARAHLNGVAAPAVQVPDAPARLTPASFPRASSMQPVGISKQHQLDIADSDAIEVRSEGGYGTRSRLSGGLDDRDIASTPGSRPDSRRETRRTSRKSAIGSK